MPRRPYQPQQFLFAPGELEAVRCPLCGGPLVESEPDRNDRGDLVQFGFCAACTDPAHPDRRCLVLPASARKLFH